MSIENEWAKNLYAEGWRSKDEMHMAKIKGLDEETAFDLARELEKIENAKGEIA